MLEHVWRMTRNRRRKLVSVLSVNSTVSSTSTERHSPPTVSPVSTVASSFHASVLSSTAAATSASTTHSSRSCSATTPACCSRSRSATLWPSHRAWSPIQSTQFVVAWWWPRVRPRSTTARLTASLRSWKRRASCRWWRVRARTFWEVSPAPVCSRVSTRWFNCTLVSRSTHQAVNFCCARVFFLKTMVWLSFFQK